MNFQKTIIVTGSTSGIGLSIIEKFYEENFNCIIVGKVKSLVIKKLKNKFDTERTLILNLDLTKINNVKKLIILATKKFKKIDVLVNCAGMQVVESLEKYNESIWKKLLDINPDIIHYARSGYYEWPFTKRLSPIQIETNIFGFKDSTPFLDYSIAISNTIKNYSATSPSFFQRHLALQIQAYVSEPFATYRPELATLWRQKAAARRRWHRSNCGGYPLAP